MDEARLRELIAKYNAMVADPAEIREIEGMIERGEVDLAQFSELHSMHERVDRYESPEPTMRLDASFYAMLEGERPKSGSSTWRNWFAWPTLAPRLAFASVALLLGLAAGFFMRSPHANDQQLEVLGKEVSGLKEVVMLSLLEKESTTERLKAVSLTQEMDKASQTVTSALLHTLNNDENVNVRLAALDALKGYGNDSKVREGLIRSIRRQDSPLVQIALAETMVALQAKSSVKELEKIVQDENTPADVKKKIEESIKVLI